MTRERLHRSVFTVGLVILTMLLAISAHAQSANARILGHVTDPQGAVLPNTHITVVNVGTQVTYKTESDSQGNYEVIALPIGSYQVLAEHDGFASLKTTAYELQINQNQRIDLKLNIGSKTDIVEVKSEGAGVETVSSTIAASVTERPIVNLPLNGRRVLDLALLQPGVTENNSDDGSAGTFNVAGGRSDSVTFILDGGNNNNLLSNGVVFTPNPDAVAEFRILENNYGAEYGRNAGGVITLVTKSGSNAVHGSVYEFARNDAFNANSYFNKRKDLPRDVLKRHQFGTTGGFPIIKDRIFGFVAYEGQRQTASSRQTLNVFTPAELNGDFSGATPEQKAGITDFLNRNPFYQADQAKRNNAIIDPTKIDPVVKNYIAAGLVPSSPNGVLSPAGAATDNRNQLLSKLDFVVTQNDRMSLTLGRNSVSQLIPFRSDATAPGYPNSTDSKQYFMTAAYTKTFTPTLLNEFRFTAQRNNNFQAVPAAKLPVASDLGVGITPDEPTGPPRIVFNESNLALGFSPQGPTKLIDNTFSYSNVLSWVKGRHTVKSGFYFSPYDNNTVFDFFVNGEFDFDGSVAGVAGTNFDFADFLIGLPDFYLQFGRAPSNIRTKQYSAFAQDEWKLTSNLVLTYGLRYEYSTPKFDTQGRSFSLNLGAQSTRFVNAPKGLLFSGDPGAPKGANFPDRNDFAPRLGFAWSPGHSGKTSVRGGVGMFYDILKGEDNLQFNGQAPFFGFAFLLFDPVDDGSTQLNYLSQPFVATGQPNSFPSKPPTKDLDFGAAGFLPFGGGGVFFVDPHLRTPYTFQYNLSVQRELVKNLLGEVAYVGSQSRKLTALKDANPYPLGASDRVFNAQPGVDPFSFNFLDEFQNTVNANYNALEMSLTKRSSETKWFGTTYFTLAYTYQKSIDNASGFRQRNSQVPAFLPNLFRSVSDFDITHRITFSGGWDLPLDHAWTSGPRMLTKGWSLYPIISWRTGFPLDILAGFQQGFDPGPTGVGDGDLRRVDYPGGRVATFDPTKTNAPGFHGGQYFNGDQFTVPVDPDVISGYGNLPRNFFRGPGRINTDLAIAKAFPIKGDRVTFEFRTEFFNLFNHAEFDNPSTVFGSAQLGYITSTASPRIIQFGGRIRF